MNTYPEKNEQIERITELESLVKRHEAALNFIATVEDEISVWRDSKKKVLITNYGTVQKQYGEFDTPLEAIERVMRWAASLKDKL